MRGFACLLPPLACAATACNRPDAAAGTANTTATTAPSTNLASASSAAIPALTPSPYEVRSLIDPGLNDLAAAALLAPESWQLRQGLRRTWQGAVPELHVYASLTAPDGRGSIEFLPEVVYHFTDWVSLPAYWTDPVEHPPSPLERYPMAPLTYLRLELLPQLTRLLGRPVHLTASRGDSVLPAQGLLPASATAFVEGVLPTGRHLRLYTKIQFQQTKGKLFTTYVWAAYTTLVQSDTALATCTTYGEVARQTLAPNPTWTRQQQLLVRDGRQLDSVAYLAMSAPSGRPRKPPRLLAPPSAARACQRQRTAQPHSQPEYAGPARPVRRADSTASAPVYLLAAGQTFRLNAPLDTARVAWGALQRRETARYQRPLATLPGRRLMRVPLPTPGRHEHLYYRYRHY